MKNLNFKAMNEGQLTVDEAQGIVECFVAAVGNKDSVGDIIVPGAFEVSFKKRKPRVVWGHDWNQPIGKVLDIYEVGPRDPRLPQKMRQAGVGGVFAKVQFNLNSERGREAFSNVMFFGEEQEWSIGYKTIDAVWDPNTQANVLRELELYEVSPVLHGANQLTATISIKDAKSSGDDEVTSLRDSKWDTFDIAWAKKLKDEHPDIWSKGGNIKGNDQWRILTQIAEKGKATTQAELNALKLREAWIARHKGDFRLPGVIAQIKWLAVGTRGEDYMKNVVREAIDRKDKKDDWSDDISSKADGIRKGSLVRWNSSGGTAYGKVVEVARQGTVSAEPTGPSMGGTEDDPAVRVQVWKFANGKWTETDTVTVHRTRSLNVIDSLPESKAAPSLADIDVITDAVGLDPLPQERITGDVMRGYGPRRGNLERLLRYWRPIMRKPGGFRRCLVILADHPELYPLENLCAWLHHETTGLWPNEGCHHPGMKNCRRKMRGVVNGSLLSNSEFDNRMRRLGSGKKDASASIEDYAPAEQKFIRSLLAIVAEHGRLSDSDDNGIYVGYTPADQNEVAEIGIKCANCAFYAGGNMCRIVETEVEPGGKCRLAAIDYDSVEEDDDESMIRMFSSALSDFVRYEPEFMEYLGNDDNWVHEGQEYDEDDWYEHIPLAPMGKKPCGCGCGEKSDRDISVKAGRTLSGRNRTRLNDAVQLIKSVIDEADIMVKEQNVKASRGETVLKVSDPHGLAEDIAPIARHYGIAVKVGIGRVILPGTMNNQAVKAINNALGNLDYSVKALPRIGGGGGFDPDAEDGDEDGTVQDSTPFERPATPRVPKARDMEGIFWDPWNDEYVDANGDGVPDDRLLGLGLDPDGVDVPEDIPYYPDSQALPKAPKAPKMTVDDILDSLDAGGVGMFGAVREAMKLNGKDPDEKEILEMIDLISTAQRKPGAFTRADKERLAKAGLWKFVQRGQRADAKPVAPAQNKPTGPMTREDVLNSLETGGVGMFGAVRELMRMAGGDPDDKEVTDAIGAIQRVSRDDTEGGASLGDYDIVERYGLKPFVLSDRRSREDEYQKRREETMRILDEERAKIDDLEALLRSGDPADLEKASREVARVQNSLEGAYNLSRYTDDDTNYDAVQLMNRLNDLEFEILEAVMNSRDAGLTDEQKAARDRFNAHEADHQEMMERLNDPGLLDSDGVSQISYPVTEIETPTGDYLEGFDEDVWRSIVVDKKGNRGIVTGLHDGEIPDVPRTIDIYWPHTETSESYDIDDLYGGTNQSKFEFYNGWDEEDLIQHFDNRSYYIDKADEVYRKAWREKDPSLLYAIRGTVPEVVYERMLERLNRAINDGDRFPPKPAWMKSLRPMFSVDAQMHKSLLPVVKHHGIPYTVTAKGVVYDLSSSGAAASKAMLTASRNLVSVKREYGTDKREEYAKRGWALPDGSFPIRDKGDLDNAIKAYGRAKNKPRAKAHIIKRARQLNALSMLPEGWK